jgi:UPF0271 protein
MAFIDLNSDLGESFGAYVMGDDAAMLKIITSANVACGFHGGDPLVMHQTLTLAKENGVAIGAHPGFIDLWGFGRRPILGDSPADIEKILIYQIGAIQGMARSLGMTVGHFKAHGSLGNMAEGDAVIAAACARAVKAVDPTLIFVVMPGNQMEKAGDKAGLRMAREVYADRAYTDDGKLVSRKLEGAVIHDPAVAIPRLVRMVEDQEIVSIGGKRLPVAVDSVCVHGDNPAAVAMAAGIRQALGDAGFTLRPMADFVR